jgi:hypothetical protein
MLTDEQVVTIVRKHIEAQFPKHCSCCGHVYETLADYLIGTTHLGEPMSADDPFEAIEPRRLIGTISFANCSCGTTLAISSRGLDVLTMWRLLQWAGASIARRHIPLSELLAELRSRIDDEVLREHDAQKDHEPDRTPTRLAAPPR